MNEPEKKTLVGICLVAAFADGEKSESERRQIQRAADAFELGPVELTDYYEHAASGVLSAQTLGSTLQNRETRLLAYEMALGICEADEQLNNAESAFLKELQAALELDDSAIQAARSTTRQLQAQVLSSTATPPVMTEAPTPPVEGTDRLILEHAIVCGALELLPETLATMAILPTQMKMVYQIGQIHGVTLDRRLIKELLMATGVGLSSQVLESYATKLAKGLLGRVLGGVGRAAAGPLTGAAMSFATTYALGQVAKQYYAGGRTLSQIQLRAAFDSVLSEAKGLQATYAPQIQACSRKLRLQNLLPGSKL